MDLLNLTFNPSAYRPKPPSQAVTGNRQAVLFGRQTQEESLIRRIAFHLGEHPWTGSPGDEKSAGTSLETPNEKSKGLHVLLKPASRTLQFIAETLNPFVHQWEKPTIVVAGGTIDTAQDSDTGTRLPDPRTQARRLEVIQSQTHRHLNPFPALAPDSSNLNRDFQQQIMKQLGVQVLENLQFVEQGALHRFHGAPKKTDKPAVRLDDIPKYFNTPRKWRRGVYVTHGTDTLAYNAAMAAYLFRDAHLVSVWTGAWNSQTEPGFDGARNEERARLLASHPYMPPGAYIVIGDQIHLAVKAQKINNHPFHPQKPVPFAPGNDGKVSYFASMDDQPVGYFDEAGQPHINTGFLRQEEARADQHAATEAPEALIRRYSEKDALKPAHAELIVMNAQTPYKAFTDLCHRLEKQGPHAGAILEGDIAHRSDWPEMARRMDALRKKNIHILPTPKNLSAQQAHIKLSALLSEKSGAEVKEAMHRNLLGESLPPEVVGREQLHLPEDFFENKEWIQASPALQPEAIQDATRRLMDRKARYPSIVINGTGDGHIPIGAMTMKQRIEEGYQKLGRLEDLKRLQTAMARQKMDYTLSNVTKALVGLRSGEGASVNPDIGQQARNELKHVLRHSDPMLAAIGEAQDRGVQVQMGTQVPYAKPNLASYEIGEILTALGVTAFTKKLTH